MTNSEFISKHFFRLLVWLGFMLIAFGSTGWIIAGRVVAGGTIIVCLFLLTLVISFPQFTETKNKTVNMEGRISRRAVAWSIAESVSYVIIAISLKEKAIVILSTGQLALYVLAIFVLVDYRSEQKTEAQHGE